MRTSNGAKLTSLEFAQLKARESLQKTPLQEDEQTVLNLALPAWTDEQRGIPNGFLRSGLFTASSRTLREDIKNAKIASLSNYDLTYSGSELRQDDLSLWISLMTRARGQAIGDKLFFSGYSLVKDLGWSLNSISYARAKACIERMKLTAVTIKSKNQKQAYAGALIRDYAYDESDGSGNASWMVRFEPTIARLFVNEAPTFLEWSQRKTLGTRSNLAQWLHGYFSSHSEPFPISVSKVHELSKSQQKSMANFKIRCREALELLIQCGCLVSYNINTGDMIHVVKAKRHLRVA